jgi:hypothetical protein
MSEDFLPDTNETPESRVSREASTEPTSNRESLKKALIRKAEG